MSLEESQHKIWWWETLFQELNLFICDADRRLGNSTIDYAQYAVERREICVQLIFHLKEHM